MATRSTSSSSGDEKGDRDIEKAEAEVQVRCTTCIITETQDPLQEIVEPEFDASDPANKRLVWKTDIRIVPLSAFIYLLCNLDRSNIGAFYLIRVGKRDPNEKCSGNAKIMNRESGNDLLSQTHMSNHQYTIALMIFYLAYALFEVPSNVFLKRLKPSVSLHRFDLLLNS